MAVVGKRLKEADGQKKAYLQARSARSTPFGQGKLLISRASCLQARQAAYKQSMANVILLEMPGGEAAIPQQNAAVGAGALSWLKAWDVPKL